MTYLLYFVHLIIWKKVTSCLNSKHKNIKFTYEKESNNSLPFVGILISRSENDFKTSVYYTSTFSEGYPNLNSFINDQNKVGLIFTLLFTTFSTVSDFSGFSNLKGHFKKECVSHQTDWQLQKTFLNKEFLHSFVALTVEKKEFFIALPYLGNLSLAIRTRNLPFCEMKVIFDSAARLSNFFRFKDKVSFNLRSNVIYKFSCGRCNATYYDETYRRLNIRVPDYSGV